MVSGVHNHDRHVDWSGRAARAHLDANARQLAQQTLAGLQQKITDTALHELKDDQRLLDVFA